MDAPRGGPEPEVFDPDKPAGDFTTPRISRAAVAVSEAARLRVPALENETRLLQAQAMAQEAILAAQVQGLGQRQQALVAAQNAVNLAEAERDAALEKSNVELRDLRTLRKA